MMMEILLTLLFAVFVFWLAFRILEKAGINQLWAFKLVIPVVNIIMVWIFAFVEWPNSKKKNADI
jgi:hypothetical protein